MRCLAISDFAGLTWTLKQLLKLMPAVLVVAGFLRAALPNLTTWEVRTNGAATNGGGFVTGASGTDYSQNNNKNAAACSNCGSSTVNLSVADLVTNGSTTVTSATANFSAAAVGNIVRINGGTGAIAANYYEVVTFTNSTTVVLDRSTGLTTGTGATINIGGALNSLATLNTALQTTNNIQQTAYVKADATYTVTANQSLAPTCTSGTNGCSIQVNGYTTSRGDNGKATVQGSSGSGYVLVSIDNNNNLQNLVFRNFVLDCNSLTGSTGFSINANGNVGENLEAKNCGSYGISVSQSGGNSGVCRNCYSHNNPGGSGNSGGFEIGSNSSAASLCIWCVAIANGTSGTSNASGFVLNGASVCQFCISANNTGRTTGANVGFLITSLQGNVVINNSVSYGNRDDGVKIAVNSDFLWTIANTVIVANQGWGINSANTTYVAGSAQWENYNFFFNNTSGSVTGLTIGANDICPSGCGTTSTADPFTNGAGNVFTLNNTAGGGKLARGAGFPGAMNAGGTGFLDMGALEVQLTGAGGAFGFVGP